MPSILDYSPANSGKVLLIGRSGSGKTGSLASLVAGGYKLRILDTDKGARSLRSLLTDTHYPYSKLIEKNQIDLRAAVDIVPIDEPMRPSAKHDSITPVAASAWPKLVSLLDKWKYSDTDLGSLRSWDENTILVLDTLSTVSEGAFNQIQGLNNRLGAIASGFDYQRDIGGAQNLVKSLLQLLYDSSIKCGVIIVTHITFVDESRGLAARPGESGLPEGYPSAIGRALSTQIGKYFNDVFLVRSTGSGQSVKREIWTVPQDGVVLKNSVYLEKSYPISSGMIEIFSALQNKPYPSELVRAIRGEDKNNQNPPTSGAPPHPNPIRPKL